MRLGVAGLSTAFDATVGSGPLAVGICCEYDALPDIGHACGHNVIAAAGVGAGLALAPFRRRARLHGAATSSAPPPKREAVARSSCSKRGFRRCGAVMMVHPARRARTDAVCLAVAHFDVPFPRQGGTRLGLPELGVNAADADRLICPGRHGLLRQHAKTA